jgi:excisionase family DNA binding protein
MQKRPTSSDNLLSKIETAERLNISLRTLDTRIKAGSIPFLKIGKLIRFIPSDIEKFIEAHRIGG